MIQIDYDSFGNYGDYELIGKITLKVFETLSEPAGINPFGEILITYSDKGPSCGDFHPEVKDKPVQLDVETSPKSPLVRVVRLSSPPFRWSQWIYQLGHEACHHLINGTMHYLPYGLQWFEEILCETASLFCLSKLSRNTVWQQWGCLRYALCVQSYLDNQLHESVFLRQSYYSWNDFEHSEGIRPWLGILGETSTQGITPEQRTLCNAVASLILPTFLRTPRLWEILGHIAPSENWQSLEALLAHLESKVAPDVSDAVRELRTVLLGD